MSDDATAELEQRLGYAFRERGRLVQALTHRSSSAAEADNERLEFLGDAVLGLCVSRHLWQQHPQASEGELTRIRGWLVSARNCAQVAQELDLGRHLRLGAGEEAVGGRQKQRLLANALEAVFGAVFLDGGFEAAAACIEHCFVVSSASRWPAGGLHPFAYKSALQEWAHAAGHALPVYRVVDTSGPEHQRHYTVEAAIAGGASARGVGASKKEAEQRAAAALLAALGKH
ncbi:MAG TPA: ribonuclease III [Terriglobales bacterium]|nr:ribonuclease III [Terriglobales bacterium]